MNNQPDKGNTVNIKLISTSLVLLLTKEIRKLSKRKDMITIRSESIRRKWILSTGKIERISMTMESREK